MEEETVKIIRIGRYELQRCFRPGEPAAFVQGSETTRIYRARIYCNERPTKDVPGEVALKTFRVPRFNAEQRRARFRQEALIANMLNHPNIIPFYESGSAELDGQMVEFHAMELGGENLSQFINRRRNELRPLSVDEALTIAGQIAEAIDYVHEKGIVLRDVKPTNFVRTRDGETVKLIDFDNAWIIGGPGARDRVGSTIFSAPEHFPDRELKSEPYATPASDIFSLAKIIFVLLTGQYPPGVNALPINSLPEPIASEQWADDVCRILKAATRVDPSARHQNAAELVNELRSAIAARRQPVVEAAEVTEPNVTEIRLASRRARRHRRRLAAATIILAVFAMVIVSSFVVQKQLLGARRTPRSLPCEKTNDLIERTLIAKTRVNLRAGPSSLAPVLCTMNAGSAAFVIGETTNKWAKVQIRQAGTSPGASCPIETEGYVNVEYFEVKCP